MTEYKVTEFKYWFSSKPISINMEKHMNEMSREGWELVETISTLGVLESPNYVRHIWKKKSD
jgi:hypothetical protein